MKCLIKSFLAFSLVSGLVLSSCKEEEDNSIRVTFESLNVGANGYWNGSVDSIGFRTGGIRFPNSYSVTYWSGFAYSNRHDIRTSDYSNQYSAYSMKDTTGSNTFIVAYPFTDVNAITFDNEVSGVRMKVTNTTLTALSMKEGTLSKKFGGADSTEKDWYKLSIIAFDADNLPIDTSAVYLADYRYTNNKQDYIVDEWLTLDLSKFGIVKKLVFELSSSDNNEYGMLTPGYFCIDDIEYTPVLETE